MPSGLPFSQASENNKKPILEALSVWLKDSTAVLEVGSGTAQHAVFFAPRLQHLIWNTSDLQENHAAIAARLSVEAAANLRAPVLLDTRDPQWPSSVAGLGVDAIYSANTAHIMHWDAVTSMFSGVGAVLPAGGLFLLYGPFSYGGEHTSAGNRAFDASLRASDAGKGIRDRNDLDDLADKAGLSLARDQDMPANNRLLVWRR